MHRQGSARAQSQCFNLARHGVRVWGGRAGGKGNPHLGMPPWRVCNSSAASVAAAWITALRRWLPCEPERVESVAAVLDGNAPKVWLLCWTPLCQKCGCFAGRRRSISAAAVLDGDAPKEWLLCWTCQKCGCCEDWPSCAQLLASMRHMLGCCEGHTATKV
mmetsp:Transcript_20328/g.60430  ORF Transcript_20328/g.60430 Transcript_20328/m.60430 type:complete len:161 (-) Transcript_20328:674-1156(-)